jgi:hypothetical protein
MYGLFSSVHKKFFASLYLNKVSLHLLHNPLDRIHLLSTGAMQSERTDCMGLSSVN